ncbi:MAG: BamA/TamA family outer membrane protein [Nevskiales bacterium]|nr:BamA/TamA family outer membrane protein [Nevskiales bacterium]
MKIGGRESGDGGQKSAIILAAAFGIFATVAVAQEPYPAIREIRFVGNDITRPDVMLREMVIKVGDPADPGRIERSRQGVLDLGLFTAVDVVQEPLEDGVRLTFTVKEKFYLIPIPRYDVNSEGEKSYGASLRWYNVTGRNHTLRANWTRREESDANIGTTTHYSLGYAMPFAFDSPYYLSLDYGHSLSPITDALAVPALDYTEAVDSFSISLSRTFAGETASQGWTLGGTLDWNHQRTSGPVAPEPYGMATAPGFSANYGNVRFRVYSEEGVRYGVQLSSAKDGIASDYSFNRLKAHYTRYLSVGETPHQSLHLIANGGTYHGGPVQRTSSSNFTLGGTSQLRGYPGSFLEGDAVYYLSAEYLRPVHWNWLRLLVVAEAGNVFSDLRAANLDRVYASLGFGLRVRITFLVNVDVEAGIAVPLDGNEFRFFASKV